MINEKQTKMKCREDFSLIQNYNKAISDKEQMWDCHHRLGTVIPKEKLLEMDLYYHRPAIELIFLTREEHNKIHLGMKGKHHSDTSKQKMSEAHKNLSEEAHKNMSKAQLKRFENKENHPMLGHKHTDESKQKMSNSWNREANRMKGHKHTDESKQKMRNAKLGKEAAIKGRKAIYKDGIKKFPKLEDLQKYLDEGWQMKFKYLVIS